MAKSHHHNTTEQTNTTHPGGGLTPRRDWVAGLFRTVSGRSDPMDADAGQTDVSVYAARRNDRGRSSRRRRQRPRRRSLTLLLALQPLLDDSVDSTPLQADGPGSAFVPRTVRQSPTTLRLSLQPLQTTASSRLQRRSRFRFVPATDRLSLLLLPTTATSLSADVPWLPSRPASQRSTLRIPATVPGTAVPRNQRRQHSQGEALLRLTRSIRPGAISLSARCRAHTQLKLHFRSTFHNTACSCSCSLAVLDPRVGHTMDVLSPFIPVLCHSD